MDEYIVKSTSLLRYVPYILEEKAEVQCFISNLLVSMKERLEFDNPKTMDEAICKAWIFYQRSKQNGGNNNSWIGKKGKKNPPNSKNIKTIGSKILSKGQPSKFIGKV